MASDLNVNRVKPVTSDYNVNRRRMNQTQTQIDINWTSLWDNNKVEFWSLILFFFASALATAIRIIRRGRNGNYGVRSGHEAPAVSYRTESGTRCPEINVELPGDGVDNNQGSTDGGEGSGGGGEARDGRHESRFVHTAGRQSWRW